MVVAESEMNSQNDAESPIELEQQHDVNKNHPFSSLGREASSIYSITLDEFQHTLWESGKNFGSMNMDEFLSSIWWCAEETQILNNSNNSFSLSEASAEKGLIRKQPSLPRQGSLTLPAPLCRKTVDEVWSEIHKGQQQRQPQKNNDNNCGNVNNDYNAQNTESARRQPTFGEMTLEDFLIKAGIVREQCAIATPVPASTSQNQHLQQYGFFPNNNRTMDPSFVGRQMMGVGGGGNAGGNVVRPSYQAVPKGGGGRGAVGQSSGYPAAVPSAVCFGPRVVNGGGGYEAVSNMGVVAPVSPVSPEGIGTGEKFGCRFGMEKVVSRGRKRVFDGPVEKVVERRQRRMIKNRESAARSRARKLAYTVELEAELTQLKEENAELKLSLADLERRRKQQSPFVQQHSEEGNWRVQNNLENAKNKSRSLRRTMSCPL
ncbi:protein ABSCISIC ACID-INSENSITIVE 5 isoform X2 [Vigna radiata var. radiata]|uniref:Protein ABSCISIC ACID-INSENSITIVE 5 isoform X2 n=1 Tax=Vigna radiata var. radiata TaxID=3916 RepID=A0A3Q0F9D7_VIGRR|nr:protein ABSCISIC ACID-INSENSITIVE 5 isoform X2 [Vigna radiata var. radiata]